jgi:hypothetical protein
MTPPSPDLVPYDLPTLGLGRGYDVVGDVARVLGRGGWPACVVVGWRAAGDELGLQAVEDGVEAELEGVLGCRAVVGGGGVQAVAQQLPLGGRVGPSAVRNGVLIGRTSWWARVSV